MSEEGDITDKNEMSEKEKITFQRDALGRQKFCDDLRGRILDECGDFDDGYAVCVHGDYGTGKTWLMKMWKKLLEKQDQRVIYVDMWEEELHGNPLLSLGHSILDLLGEDSTITKLKNKKEKIIERIDLTSSSLSTIMSLLSTLLSGLPIAMHTKPKSRDNYLDSKKIFTTLKSRIEDKIKEQNKSPLFILVDELDRTKPPFALETLEIAKHLFSIPGIVFVFSVHKKQLIDSIKHGYGNMRDPEGYFRRFFKVQIEIPKIDYKKFNQNLHNMTLKLLEKKGKNRSSIEFSHGHPRDGLRPSFIIPHLMSSSNCSLRDCEELYRSFLFFFQKEKESKQSMHIDCAEFIILALVLHMKKENLFKKMHTLFQVPNKDRLDNFIDDFLKLIQPAIHFSPFKKNQIKYLDHDVKRLVFKNLPKNTYKSSKYYDSQEDYAKTPEADPDLEYIAPTYLDRIAEGTPFHKPISK